eukprot:TRINITY_DN28462_c0_g1_i1.p1 TRINITY_DN28462_c0_g1~~TRINITY_DN28462_c0_g1_i1.p1  ORF type:complete len:224 (+),score=17.78 TRINITY_DN28462_c0_g1_i1:46-717(+)
MALFYLCRAASERGSLSTATQARRRFSQSTQSMASKPEQNYDTREVDISGSVTNTSSWCTYCGLQSVFASSCECRTAVYCDEVCQAKDWEVHEKQCTNQPICAICSRTWHDTSLLQCSCRKAVYCSLECQSIHWDTHRDICSFRDLNGEEVPPTPGQELTKLLQPAKNEPTCTKNKDSFKSENDHLKEELGCLVPWLMTNSEVSKTDQTFKVDKVLSEGNSSL